MQILFYGNSALGCPPLFSAVQLPHDFPDLAAGVSLLEQLGADGRITAALTAHPRRAVRHGAAPDCWFSHLAVEVPGEDTSNEWCEPVPEETYKELR